MDRIFKQVGAHGKQSLTMAMGFGCNAAAVMSTRIIESPRERMLAILTNNFVPCNGRWGTLIVLSSLFMAANFSGGLKSLVIHRCHCWHLFYLESSLPFLSLGFFRKPALKGMPTHYTLELPPYRRPKIFDTVIRSSLTKSWSVLIRAVKVAAPAAILTWVIANIYIGDTSILMYVVEFLDPFGQLLGLDGYIMLAFILGLPANEIVLPILLMGYLSTGSLTEVDSLVDLKQIFLIMLDMADSIKHDVIFSPALSVWNDILNIYKETKSIKWTFFPSLFPQSSPFLSH